MRSVIDYALATGWDPDLGGGTFFLGEREHASVFELDGFLLTDRLRDEGAPDPTARVFRAFDEREAAVAGSPVKPSSDGHPGPAG